MKLTWYVNRLSVMGFSETLLRFALKIKSLSWRIGLLMPQERSSFTVPHHISNYPFDIYSYKEEIIKEADGYLLNKWYFFGQDISEKEIVWSFDPVNKKNCPSKFSLFLDHRNKELFGDAKIIWEKNRFHHLVVLACAFKLTNETKYIKVIEKQVVSWIEENRFLYGPNWTHPLEAAIRLISLVWIFRLTEKSDLYFSINKKVRLSKIIYMHIWIIYQCKSSGSSANNHLIGELVGLIVGCSLFSEDKKINKLKSKCIKLLEKELLHQTYSCGMNKELGYDYHLFVMEFVVILVHEMKILGKKENIVFKDVLIRMSRVLEHLHSTYSCIPSYGDGDNGLVLQMYPRKCNREMLLREAVKKLVSWDAIPDSSFTKSIVEDAGLLHYSAEYRDCKIGLLFDAGPLGMGPLYAHGHADALSFCLNINGQPVFIDTGTYTYFGDSIARSYFRSTRAHNTLCIDGFDQCMQTGLFMWKDISRTKLEFAEIRRDELLIKATHNGYRKIGVAHSRMLHYTKNKIIILDNIEGNGSHTIEMNYHLNPGCIFLENTGTSMKFILNNRTISIGFKENCQIYYYFGSAKIDEGWYSPAFGILKPCHTIRTKVFSETIPVELKTEIEVES